MILAKEFGATEFFNPSEHTKPAQQVFKHIVCMCVLPQNALYKPWRRGLFQSKFQCHLFTNLCSAMSEVAMHGLAKVHHGMICLIVSYLCVLTHLTVRSDWFALCTLQVLVEITDGGLDYTFECIGNVKTMVSHTQTHYSGIFVAL